MEVNLDLDLRVNFCRDYLQLETGLGRCVNGVVVALSKPVYHLDAVAMAQSLLDKLSQVGGEGRDHRIW